MVFGRRERTALVIKSSKRFRPTNGRPTRCNTSIVWSVMPLSGHSLEKARGAATGRAGKQHSWAGKSANRPMSLTIIAFADRFESEGLFLSLRRFFAFHAIAPAAGVAPRSRRSIVSCRASHPKVELLHLRRYIQVANRQFFRIDIRHESCCFVDWRFEFLVRHDDSCGSSARLFTLSLFPGMEFR
jgi:hypothetical protein